MSGQSKVAIPVEGVSRVLDYGAVRVHDSHIQGGQRTSLSCRLCGEGLAGLVAPVEAERAGDSGDAVAEGDGADKKGDAASPSGDWGGDRQSALLA